MAISLLFSDFLFCLVGPRCEIQRSSFAAEARKRVSNQDFGNDEGNRENRENQEKKKEKSGNSGMYIS